MSKNILNIIFSTKRKNTDPEKIISQAHQKAEKILLNAETSTDEFEKEWQAAWKTALTKNLERLDANTELLGKTWEAILDKKAESLTAAATAKLDEKIAAAMEKTAAELEDYKKQRLAGIDQEVKEKVTELARQILNRVLPLDDHMDLVLEALEKAKKNGLL